MRFSSAAALLPLAGLVSAAPTTFSLPNGFPNVPMSAIPGIEKEAGGSLPNGALPTKISTTAIDIFTLVAAQETFEVAYFTSLLNNITSKASGYSTMAEPVLISSTIRAIRAQEELHALGANAILEGVGAPTVGSCNYVFTTTTFDDAIALAATFTDVVLGTLQGVIAQLSADGGQEPALLPLIASIGEMEAEQVGLFRYLQKKYASAAPFLTSSSAPQFAWSALKGFIVPGSCAKVESAIEKAVGSFPALTVVSTPGQKTAPQKYSAAVTGISSSANSIVYITGQLLPVTVPITNVRTAGGVTTFTANFPFDSGFSKGLTIAALVKGKGKFATVADVAAATLAGPGLIEV